MHVVFGANGRAGGETARALMANGEPVRVVVRRREQAKRGRRSVPKSPSPALITQSRFPPL